MSSKSSMSSSTENTFVGYPEGAVPAVSESPRPARATFERTLLGRFDTSGERVLVQDGGDCPRFTSDMMAQLRAKLRAAEQAEEAEASGVFQRTPENGLAPVVTESPAAERELSGMSEIAPVLAETASEAECVKALLAELVREPISADPPPARATYVEAVPAPAKPAVAMTPASNPAADATLESAEIAIEHPREEEPELISPDLMASFGALSPEVADSLLAEAAAVASLDDLVAAVPELEASLAPNSESNFYSGFDEQHPDGVFLATYEQLPEGTPVYVDVLLPAGYRFRTPATVEWVREPSDDPELPCGLGLRMCGLDDAKRRLIRTYARHRKPLFWVG